MLHYNLSDLGISKQRQKLGTLIIDATATLFDDLRNSPPLGIAPTDQPLGLPLQVVLVSLLDTLAYTATVRTGVERNSGGSMMTVPVGSL